MSGDQERYASVPERITWTTGFRLPVDKHVLGVLSMFANFKTGRRAEMALETLAKRAGLSRSTALRALDRLEADGWITATRRHRRPTIYHIVVDRLASHWREVALVPKSLSVTGDTQKSDSGLRVTGDTQEPVLSVTGDTQEPILSVTGDTPSPVRTDPLYEEDPQGPGCTAPQQLTLGPEDVTGKAPGVFDASHEVESIRARLAALPSFETRRRVKHG